MFTVFSTTSTAAERWDAQAAGLVPQFNSTGLEGTLFLPSDSALAGLSSTAATVSSQQLIQVGAQC